MRSYLIVAAVILGACAADSELRAGESPGGDPRCARPNEGCSCPTPGATVACGLVKQKSGDATLCEQGLRSCGTDGAWGPCVSTGSATFSYVGGGEGLRLNGLGAPVGCGNPCDPACVQYPDTPLGLDAGPGVDISDAGVGVLDTAPRGCTSLAVVPDPGINMHDATNALPDNTITIRALSSGAPAALEDTNGGAQGTSLRFRAVLMPLGCDGYAGGGTPAQWSVDAPARAGVTVTRNPGVANNYGDLEIFTPKGGPLTVTAKAGAYTGSLVLGVRVIVDTCTAAEQTAFGAASTTTTGASAITWMYPFQNTLFPLGLEPPIVMWNRGSAAPAQASKYRLTLEHKVGTDVDFSWSTCQQELADTPRATSEPSTGRATHSSALATKAKAVLTPAAWRAFEESSAGTSTGTGAGLSDALAPGVGQLRMQRIVGGSVYREPDLTLKFSSQRLKGRVYFTSRGMHYNGASWVQDTPLEQMVDPASGALNTSIFGPNRSFCPTCHSVSGNGKVFVSSSRNRGSMNAGGLQYLDERGEARYGWFMDRPDADWYKLAAGPADPCTHVVPLQTRRYASDACYQDKTADKSPVLCAAWQGSLTWTDAACTGTDHYSFSGPPGSNDARYVDWYDSDFGRMPVGQQAPGHTWDNGNDVNRVGGGSAMSGQQATLAYHEYQWTGFRSWSKVPHGRSDSSDSGLAGTALSFDGHFALVGNAGGGSNVWTRSMYGRATNRWDNTPWRLVSIGRPVTSAATAARWSDFATTDWGGLPSCQSTAYESDQTTYKAQRFICDSTPTGAWSLADQPLIAPQFGVPDSSGNARLVAVAGGDPPGAPWPHADGATGAGNARHNLVVYDITPTPQARSELLEGASTSITYNMAKAPAFLSPRIVATDATRNFSAPVMEPGNNALLAQQCTGLRCETGTASCVIEDVATKTLTKRAFDTTSCFMGIRDYNVGNEYRRYREPFGNLNVKSCMADDQPDFTDDRQKRATPCKGADEFRDREAYPFRGVCQRSAAATYTVDVCYGAAHAGVGTVDHAAGSYWAYANAGSCGAGSAARRSSVCMPGDTYLGLRPDGGGIARYTCKARDRYEVIQCNAGNAGRVAAEYARAGAHGTTDAASCTAAANRTTPCEGTDEFIGSAEGEPMSYCLRSPAPGDRYRVHQCPSASTAWATYACDVMITPGATEYTSKVTNKTASQCEVPLPGPIYGHCDTTGADCDALHGVMLGGGESDALSFGIPQSEIVRVASGGGATWSTSALINLRAGETDPNKYRSFAPSMYPGVVGGSRWMLFPSSRRYGNAYTNDRNSVEALLGAGNEPSQCGPYDYKNQHAQTAIWMTALTNTDAAGDTSNPPFMLPGQPFGLVCDNTSIGGQVVLQEKPVWVQSACGVTEATCGSATAAAACQDDSDCCDAAAGTAVCRIDLGSVTGAAHCRPKPAAPVPAAGTCFADADCAGGAQCASVAIAASVGPPAVAAVAPCTCVPLTCAPEYLASQTFDRVFNGSCATGQQLAWTTLSWDASAGADSSVAFYVQTADSESALAVADGTLVQTTTSATTPTAGSYDLSGLPGTAESRSTLRLRIKLNPSTDHCTSPTVRSWSAQYTCRDAE